MTLALVNGNIITMSESNPKSEAVLIEGEIISKVGSTSEIIAALNRKDGSPLKPIDLKGKTVVPGFNDAHTHFMNLGLNFLRPDLSQVQTLKDALVMVRERVATTPTGDWILAVDFDETQWTPEADRRLPTLTELDEISQEHPIILRRVCGHIAVANTEALKLIEEYINTNKLEDWFELIDNETGILLEDLALSTNTLVNPTQDEMEDGLVKAIEHAHSLGVTSVRDIVNLNAIEVYSKFIHDGKLKIRISGYVKVEQFNEFLKNKSKYQDPLEEDYLKICGAKLF
ncbi:MAG: amidohydrolase family protein, partial [Thermoplasmata archaeon]|nr:amidohydrolase family protein [Thermoplasmata archaeon]